MHGCLADDCETRFSFYEMQRGQTSFDNGCVKLDDIDAATVTAQVRGRRRHPYQVQIDRDTANNGLMDFCCDCQKYRRGRTCEHIWATILALDATSRDSTLQKRKPVQKDPVSGNTPTTPKSSARNHRQKSNGQAQSRLWQRQLQGIRRLLSDEMEDLPTSVADQFTSCKTQHWFVICLDNQLEDETLSLSLFRSQLKADGEWGKPIRRGMSVYETKNVTDRTEREVFSLLQPDEDAIPYYGSFGSSYDSEFSVPPGLQDHVFSLLASTHRFAWTLTCSRSLDEAHPIAWDTAGAWSLRLELKSTASDDRTLELIPRLVRDHESRPLSDIVFAFSDGLVLFAGHLARLRPTDATWIRAFQKNGDIQFPAVQLDEFLSALARLPHVPELECGPPLEVETRVAQPQPKLVVQTPRHVGQRKENNYLNANVLFGYGSEEIDAASPQTSFWVPQERAWQTRNSTAEQQLLQQLARFPFQTVSDVFQESSELQIHRKWLTHLVSQLTAAGWQVIANGKPMRSAGSFRVDVTSHIDWFDVKAQADFGGVSVSLPELLAALKKRQDYVILDDGTCGILPEAWLQRYARLADIGTTNGATVRFAKTQALLLDMLLAEHDDTTFDRDFQKYRAKLQKFEGIKPATEPRGFRGKLRSYQRDGLGWLKFLREFEFGGCLADDMGLGKTIQVLALLESRRQRTRKKGEPRRPSIAVVPKSLVFNWMDESERFTPNLRLFNYTGLDRASRLPAWKSSDLVITTYGTLIRDIEQLRKIPFDYVILDEAQAIKNPHSQSAKACRLLKGDHRLAMTGTPVENHLGDLWSLFEFLNPGMLGNAVAFRDLASGQTDVSSSLSSLSKSLRPFILRRTKQQVLKDLPQKTEQTLYCDMTPKQSKLYIELRDHYRAHVNKKVDELGMQRSKMHVLEALLRLRQAACDPRLITKDKRTAGAKIELLVAQLEDVVAEGHKALVFSQFTSLLALVRADLDKRGWTYEYLDGKTHKRRDKVHRFQTDAACPLFLISLKAGGHGLNLTAADYVFILDPWWNPAVEAQAIDRVHRMGQTRPVMAYRIICRNTVEDKIVQLQQSKRELADAIVTASDSLIRQLSMEDLQLLFS